jgi:hypothetical protein
MWHIVEKQNACWGSGENLKERGNLEDPCTDGRTRLNTHLTRAGCGTVDLIDVSGNRDKCQAAADTVMNLRLLHDAGNCLTSWGPVSLRRTLLCGISYVKVKLSTSTLCRNTGRGEVQFHSFNISELDKCEWSTSCLGCFTHGKGTLVPTEQEGGLALQTVWRRAKSLALDILEKRNIFCARNWILDHSDCTAAPVPIIQFWPCNFLRSLHSNFMNAHFNRSSHQVFNTHKSQQCLLVQNP